MKKPTAKKKPTAEKKPAALMPEIDYDRLAAAILAQGRPAAARSGGVVTSTAQAAPEAAHKEPERNEGSSLPVKAHGEP